jgi:ferredoxin-type protein NapF
MECVENMERVENLARRRLFRGKLHQEQVLRLPWVISEQVFNQKCTQCQTCINACETQIIVKDEQGFPKIDFSKGECSFCKKCIEHCEQPLFKKTFEQKPWPVELGINDKCLAKNNIFCQSCRDECEVEAIKFSYFNAEQTTSIPQPTLNIADCTQCGACLSSCPQDAIKINFLKT